MTESLTLSKAALVTLLDTLILPNPEDSGALHIPWEQYQPTGPDIQVTYAALRRGHVSLPPSLSQSCSHPASWCIAVLTRTIIDLALTHVQLTEELASTEQATHRTDTVRADIHEFVDDVCGIRPPRWPRPWPWPPMLVSARLRPLDLLIAGAQFHKAATLTNLLQTDLFSAANQLFATGLQRLESR